MQTVLHNEIFQFKTNTAFEQVIKNCKAIDRKGQEGTWITNAVQNAYTKLHHAGYAHSAETWSANELVGGLYGIRLGNIFFGESMFSKQNNASKFAFIHYVNQLKLEGVQLIDCQVYTSHLERLGARMITRHEFKTLLNDNIS